MIATSLALFNKTLGGDAIKVGLSPVLRRRRLASPGAAAQPKRRPKMQALAPVPSKGGLGRVNLEANIIR